MNEGLAFSKQDVVMHRASGTPQVKVTNDADTGVKTKVCPSCGRELSLEKFGRHGRSKDGWTHECKECMERRRKAKKLNESNPLAKFTARQLMNELFKRGYRGELKYTEVHTIKLGQ